MMNKVYMTSDSSYTITTRIISSRPRNQAYTSHQSKLVRTYSVIETSSPIIFLEPSLRSSDALPFHHEAWDELEMLFAELDELGDIYHGIDENWLGDLRAGSGKRVEDLYDSEDW